MTRDDLLYSTGELKDFLNMELTIFYDGQIEGIYARVIKDGITMHHGKIVRSNFIAGDEHWTKSKYTVNIKKIKYYIII